MHSIYLINSAIAFVTSFSGKCEFTSISVNCNKVDAYIYSKIILN